MNAQQTIDLLQQLQKNSQMAVVVLEPAVRFADNVNTNLIDGMLVLQASFQHGAPMLTAEDAATRMSVVHELMMSAWEGRRPVDQASEVVAMIKSMAVIGEAMKGPPA